MNNRTNAKELVTNGVLIVLLLCLLLVVRAGGSQAQSMPGRVSSRAGTDNDGAGKPAVVSENGRFRLVKDAYAVERADSQIDYAGSSASRVERPFSVEQSARPLQWPQQEPKVVVPLRSAGMPDRPRDPAHSLARLREYLRSLEQENAGLKDKSDLLSRLVTEKDTGLAHLKKENADLQQNLNQLLENHVMLKEQLQQNSVKLKTELDDKNSEISNLSVMKYVRITMQTQINDLSLKVGDLTSKKAEIENSLIKVQQEKRDVEQKLVLSEAEVKKQAELNSVLNSSITGMKNEMAKKDDEVKTLKMPRHELELENIKLKGVNEEYENQIKSLNKRLDELGASKDDTKESVFELSALVTKKELEKQIESRDKDKVIAKLQEDNNKALKENESFRLLLDRQDKTMQGLRSSKIDVLESRIDALKREVSSYKGRAAVLQKQYDHERAGNRLLNKKINKMNLEMGMRAKR